MRELIGDDLYLLSEILDKTDIKIPSINKNIKIENEDGKLIDKTVKKTNEEFGMEVAIEIAKKLYKAKNEINTLLKNVFETKDDPSNLPVKEIKSMILELIQKEEFLDFFK